jgi:hypothetical protein
VRAYTPAGEFVFEFGADGSGPGSLRDPTTITIDSANIAWVHQLRGGYELYELGLEGAQFKRSTSIPVGPGALILSNSHAPIANARGGIDVLVRVDHFQRTVMSVDSLGEAFGQRAVTMPELEASQRLFFEAGGRAIEVGAPFGPGSRVAYSREVIARLPSTLRYHIELLSRAGEDVVTITRAPAPVRVSKAERDSAQRLFDTWSRGGQLSHTRIPATKPLVSAMAFDRDGRLWVELSRAGDATHRRADVYSAAGDLLFTAEWPAEIELVKQSFAATAGDIAYGVRKTIYDVQQVVRLRFDNR